ncbi:cell division protein FtsL [Hyphomicrobium sp. CS1GBMeth3]|uniref:cell division protein FtsL n=1 Tax=Hyphomicrobium sp. CS1GBMeth3 TaxID=1892845 RepID=UPI000931AD31|nr:cell division protein FtsL [Hyphomicrobium sp. CS1GBMeth3]
MHPITVSAAFLAISSAFLLYGLSYETRQLEARVTAQQRLADRTRSDISILKAERAHLARPGRIEPLARAQGLVPMADGQIVDPAGESNILTGAIAR